MDLAAIVRSAIERLDAGDVDGFLGYFTSDAKFFIGGSTRLSGDHDVASFRAVARLLAVEDGKLRRDLIDVAVAADGSWADAIIHDYVTGDGKELDYHAVLEWQMKADKVAYFWIYVHEFDAFADAWA